jgi:hypothetical protein
MAQNGELVGIDVNRALGPIEESRSHLVSELARKQAEG